MEKYWIPAFLLGETALALFTFIRHRRRAEAMIARWAEEEGFQVIYRERRGLIVKPFFWHSGFGIYRLTIQDVDGNRRKATVRCGGTTLGTAEAAVEVCWDEQASVSPHSAQDPRPA